MAEKEIAMLRSVMITLVLMMGLAFQASAQQMSDQDARLAGEGILKAFNKASLGHDATALAELYTEDAVMFGTSGPLSGRAAIEKALAERYKRFPEPSRLELVTAIGNDVMLRGGSWSGTYQGENGPVHLRGYWTTTDVRDGTTWKIRMETWNTGSPP
jgi:uncharacterized protein (TIGR02246 family)